MKLSPVTVIIPSYDPDEKLVPTLKSIQLAGFSDVIVVNDGSAPECAAIFDEVGALPFVTLLTHEVNRGKGAALKTAFSWYAANRPDGAGVVTADGDGQHLPKDIAACAEKMLDTGECVLGCRDFSLPDVPERSRKGNNITRGVFKRFFKIDVSDTQTGLRAIPSRFIPELIATEGDRYEYENNMLVTFRDKKIPFGEVPIETVYIEENKTSHFRPVRDSARIYYHLFERVIKYTLSSLFCVLLENVTQTILHDLFAEKIGGRMLLELVDFLPARIVASLINYYLNRRFVFKKQRDGRYFAKYSLLWVCQAAFTWLCTVGVQELFGGAGGVLYFIMISVIKTAIFFISYVIQNKWVFKEKQ